jgi:hypothetical protein
MPPILMRLMVVRNRYRPEPEMMWKGRKKHMTRMRRYMLGRISQASTAEGFPRVMAQKRRRETRRGIVSKEPRR